MDKKVYYEGTITFASPNILDNNLGPYKPNPSDDLHSFLRTIYILHNPSKMPTITEGDYSTKARVVREFWSDSLYVKLDGLFWTEMVSAADNADYDVLEKMLSYFLENKCPGWQIDKIS